MQKRIVISAILLLILQSLISCSQGSSNDRFLAAAAKGNVEEVNRAIQNKDVEINSADGGGPAISIAAYYGRQQVVELLIQNKADVNVRDLKGFTPLMNATLGGHVDVVHLLLDNGADPTVTVEAYDNKGPMTAADIARIRKHRDVELLIRQHTGGE